MPHANAPLAERGRLPLARCVVEQGWSLRRAAERFQVSVPTAKRWADRYRGEGERGMVDRSSRPHRCPQATRAAGGSQDQTPAHEAEARPGDDRRPPGMHASTVHRVLARERMPRLAHLDRPTGEPIERVRSSV